MAEMTGSFSIWLRSRVMASATSSKERWRGGVSRLTTTWAIMPMIVAGMIGAVPGLSFAKNLRVNVMAGVTIRAARAPCQVERFQKRPSIIITARPVMVSGKNVFTKSTMLFMYRANAVEAMKAKTRDQRATTT